MSLFYQVQCSFFDFLLSFQNDDLVAQYGDEIRSVFRDELNHAWHHGPSAVAGVWYRALAEIITLTSPRYAARLPLVAASTVLASGLTIGSALGFCTIRPSATVHACSQAQPAPQTTSHAAPAGRLVSLPDQHKMWLVCSGDANAATTAILATGRGLGTADSWTLVQQQVPASIRVCSYDAMGAGKSDPVQGNPQQRPIGQVVSDLHSLLHAAGLAQPFVLVGASAGGILVRRYQQQYPYEVGGLVFADSAHEEMEWRDAAISPQIDPDWNNPAFLRDNGFLPNQQKLTWRANLPLIDLERSEKVPPSALPNLTPQQLNAINDQWHSFQVDLASRSRYGQYRLVAGSGHNMPQQKPQAIADAIRDVVLQINPSSRPAPQPRPGSRL